MPTTEVPESDEYEECEDDELPPEFLIFTCPDLDQDEVKAREAGVKIDNILRGILDGTGDLQHVERALRDAEPTSLRARRAREQVLRALHTADVLVGNVSDAEDALTFYWNTTTRFRAEPRPVRPAQEDGLRPLD